MLSNIILKGSVFIFYNKSSSVDMMNVYTKFWILPILVFSSCSFLEHGPKEPNIAHFFQEIHISLCFTLKEECILFEYGVIFSIKYNSFNKFK